MIKELFEKLFKGQQLKQVCDDNIFEVIARQGFFWYNLVTHALDYTEPNNEYNDTSPNVASNKDVKGSVYQFKGNWHIKINTTGTPLADPSNREQWRDSVANLVNQLRTRLGYEIFAVVGPDNTPLYNDL